MNDKKEYGTEWIFCRDVDGKCLGLDPKAHVLEKQPKTITIHGRQVKGWNVKIVQQSEGHVKLPYRSSSTE